MQVREGLVWRVWDCDEKETKTKEPLEGGDRDKDRMNTELRTAGALARPGLFMLFDIRLCTRGKGCRRGEMFDRPGSGKQSDKLEIDTGNDQPKTMRVKSSETSSNTTTELRSGTVKNGSEPMVFCRRFNVASLVLVSLVFFLIPGITIVLNLLDPTIRKGGIPQCAWALHKTLTPEFGQWAQKRLESGRAIALSTDNISGTEWPLFGAVFYLWATESLQDAWDKDNQHGAVAPTIYAAETIQAATRLVIDPKQANWVKLHWGEQYLTNQNAFYRMLVISALTSHARLTGDRQYLPLLKEQVETLSAELDASPHGLLEDYPGECYPGDVLTAIAMILKADKVLGTDHRAFATRALRGFQNKAQDERGLVPYAAKANRGEAIGPSRGCGNSYVSLSAPYIWPEQANRWYALYTKYFWQETWTAAGFREFPRELPGYDWYVDVDAGPVLKGYGFAACAFGLGAARANGHFEHAYPLTAELHAVCWPLPDGTLLLPRLLSNATDAPYLGEVAILYILTRVPAEGVTVTTGGSLPLFVMILLALYFGSGLLLLGLVWRSLRAWKKRQESIVIPRPRLQFTIWVTLLIIGGIFLFVSKSLIALLLILAMQFIPRCRRQKPTLGYPSTPMSVLER